MYAGRQKVIEQIFGTWEESFEYLHRFKAEVEAKMSGSVVEIDVKEEGDEVYFNRFFCCFKLSIDGFLNGCRPYLCIDATKLNGRWNGNLASVTALDGHN
uniref:MULE transposase domain-containing protein n=1 Tax=Arundo donax TaxID=35708 RepID=A0A0A9C810_ARUDO